MFVSRKINIFRLERSIPQFAVRLSTMKGQYNWFPGIFFMCMPKSRWHSSAIPSSDKYIWEANVNTLILFHRTHSTVRRSFISGMPFSLLRKFDATSTWCFLIVGCVRDWGKMIKCNKLRCWAYRFIISYYWNWVAAAVVCVHIHSIFWSECIRIRKRARAAHMYVKKTRRYGIERLEIGRQVDHTEREEDEMLSRHNELSSLLYLCVCIFASHGASPIHSPLIPPKAKERSSARKHTQTHRKKWDSYWISWHGVREWVDVCVTYLRRQNHPDGSKTNGWNGRRKGKKNLFVSTRTRDGRD